MEGKENGGERVQHQSCFIALTSYSLFFIPSALYSLCLSVWPSPSVGPSQSFIRDKTPDKCLAIKRNQSHVFATLASSVRPSVHSSANDSSIQRSSNEKRLTIITRLVGSSDFIVGRTAAPAVHLAAASAGAHQPIPRPVQPPPAPVPYDLRPSIRPFVRQAGLKDGRVISVRGEGRLTLTYGLQKA